MRCEGGVEGLESLIGGAGEIEERGGRRSLDGR